MPIITVPRVGMDDHDNSTMNTAIEGITVAAMAVVATEATAVVVGTVEDITVRQIITN